MYTEDDDKVTVKEDNSNIQYSDFYTSFNDIEKENKKTKKNNKKAIAKKKKDVVNEEQDNDSLYETNLEEVEINNDNNRKKNIIKIGIIALLFIILIVLIIILFGMKNRVSGDIELSKSEFVLNIGDKDYISYKIIDTEKMVTSTFESSDPNIVSVGNNGELIGVSAGEATITIHYTIEGVTREKKCSVKVNANGNVNTKINLNLKLENGKDNTWSTQAVTINPEASSIFGITSIKYAVNCDNNCNYTDISNSKITISSNGVTKVKVVAKDKKNQEITKEVTIKIDKEAPEAILNSSTNITSTKDVEVCVNCSDQISGCKQNKVCKKYTSSSSNQVITVEDIAGNKKNSKTFNVTINKSSKTPVSCLLKVSSSGLVTATVKGETAYYGFNSNYSGNNETSKQITINASGNGESGAKVVHYYVKGKDGTTSRCFITVIKKCSCPNNSTSDNCQVSCTFSSQ